MEKVRLSYLVSDLVCHDIKSKEEPIFLNNLFPKKVEKKKPLLLFQNLFLNIHLATFYPFPNKEMTINHNPDVLEALANLSNDEVFTPPKLANQMLDLLPQEIWSDSSIKILDPATKSGIFLREAAKRFLKGLEKEIPDLQERINHIMTKQLYGIGITELTGLLTRRSLYCSKLADGNYSIATAFEHKEGNIRFERTEHSWKG